MNKLHTGKVVAGAEVGGGGTGNDQDNRDAIDRTSSKRGITLERKRPRYSIMCLTLNGPTLNDTNGVYDLVGPVALAPNFDITDSNFVAATGTFIQFEYEFREPAIFLGGQMFVGEDKTETPSTTAITVSKLQAADTATGPTTYDVLVIEQRTINNRLTTEDDTDVLYYIPGGGAFFATGERFRLFVQPDSDSAIGNTQGLQGTSVVLWFKTLHV